MNIESCWDSLPWIIRIGVYFKAGFIFGAVVCAVTILLMFVVVLVVPNSRRKFIDYINGK